MYEYRGRKVVMSCLLCVGLEVHDGGGMWVLCVVCIEEWYVVGVDSVKFGEFIGGLSTKNSQVYINSLKVKEMVLITIIITVFLILHIFNRLG